MTFTGRGLYASSSKEPRKWHFGWLLVGAVVAVAALVLGGLSVMGWVETNRTTETDSFDGADQVVVDNQQGSVEVTGSDGDEVSVERTIREGTLSSVTEGVNQDDDGSVVAEARCEGISWFGTCRVDYEIAVPEGTDVEIDNTSGGVGLNSLAGDGNVEVSTASGGVQADDVAGNLTAETTSGGLELSDIGGNMDLESSSGTISASGSGDSIRAESTSGGVELEPSDATDVEANATSGSVTVDGVFQTLNTYVSSGGIDINAAETFDRVTANSSSGSIAMRVPDTAYAVTTETSSGNQDIGVTKDDSADSEIDAEASSGGIEIMPTG